MCAAVWGTTACLLSGALLTIATLLLLTNSLTIALTTIASVGIVLIAFLGYMVQRGYSLGVIEATSVTIFVGLACDYCVHVIQVHRMLLVQYEQHPCSSKTMLRHTLCHSAPSLYGAALTTASACLPLLGCSLLAFVRMGEFISVCMALSLAVATTLLAPGLCIVEEARASARNWFSLTRARSTAHDHETRTA